MDVELPGRQPPQCQAGGQVGHPDLRGHQDEGLRRADLLPIAKLGEGETLVQYVETSAINYRRYGRVGGAQLLHLRRTCRWRTPSVRRSNTLRPEKRICWHLPRGSFTDIKKIRKNTRIFEYDLARAKVSQVLSAAAWSTAPRLSPRFSLFQGAGSGRVRAGHGHL
ncbi:MAG: hypothetical protein M0C28_19195 [Candidatus Moduliflexus flocculans]|nr:hypothetical protein [Candidatus Moduliflexus flocculans]